MPNATCTLPDCTKPHRAKGYCNTHYKQRLSPYRRVQIPCTNCGAPLNKPATAKYANRFCDYACRDEWRFWQKPLTCPVPDSHPSRSTPVPSDHPSRIPNTCAVPTDHPSRTTRRPWMAGYCADCGTSYIIASEWATHSRYCSKQCMTRVAKRTRRAREHGATGDWTWDGFIKLAMRLGKVCAYCGGDNNGQPLEPDHVVPLSRGGHNGLTNLLPSCRRCNGDKRDLLIHEWAADRENRGLPHVRYDISRFDHLTAHRHPYAA